jgi:cytochrome P450
MKLGADYSIQFGLGARNCIGRHISMLEMTKLIPRIIRDFDFELEENRPWATQNLWFVKPVDFRVKIKARQKV